MSINLSNPEGWVYVMTHPAWDKMGMVKIGMTAMDPHKRAAQITTASGLLAPCSIAYCVHVPDRRAAERAMHARLAHCRARKRRELFRVSVSEAANMLDNIGDYPVVVSRRAANVRAYRPLPPRMVFRKRSRGSYQLLLFVSVAMLVLILIL